MRDGIQWKSIDRTIIKKFSSVFEIYSVSKKNMNMHADWTPRSAKTNSSENNNKHFTRSYVSIQGDWNSKKIKFIDDSTDVDRI